MSWDSYIRAVLRVERPEGAQWIRPAALGRSHGIDFPDSSGRTVHVITAYNPAGKVVTDKVNIAAHQRLEARLQEMGASYLAAAGGDVEWAHVEPGFAILGMSENDARALGREFGQDAIFGLSPTALVILSCDTSRTHVTGWEASPDAAG